MAFMSVQMWFKATYSWHNLSQVKHCFCHPDLTMAYYSEGARVFLKVVCFRLFCASKEGYIKQQSNIYINSVDKLCYTLIILMIMIYYMKPNQPAEGSTPAIKRTTSENQNDYEVLGTLGKGAYGNVSLAQKSGKLYAIKRIEKKKLAKEGKQYQAFVERELLRKINHPGIIKLAKCYQDAKNLNYVLEYCHGGDFTSFIRSCNQLFTQEMRVFYVAEIVSVLQYLHGAGITHRDLKPQNIMLSKDGHLKLIDFGTAEITRCTIVDEKFKQDIEKQKKTTSLSKKNSSIQQPTEQDPPAQEEQISPRKRRSTFVGTCYYLSPQLLEHNICEPPSDLWALGCIIYQLYYLEPPFKAAHEYHLFQKIKNVEVTYPKNDVITDQAIDLIKRLLVKIPEDRLGSNEKQGLMWKDLKAHPYFKNINFENLFSQKVPPLKEQKQENGAKLKNIQIEILEDNEQVVSKIKQQIIFSGLVEKKTFAAYAPHILILKKGFQILRLSQKKGNRKIVVSPISEDTVAELIDNNKFKIIADECTWTVRSPTAEKWVEVLNSEYKNHKSQLS